MKKLLSRIASEILFCLGDWISYPMAHFDWAWLYPTYNKLMWLSMGVQIWGGTDNPWTIK